MDDIFKRRLEIHDEFEKEVMDLIRGVTDRKHLPDRRVSFYSTPVSFDVKTTCNVEKDAHDEYFRLIDEGEPVFIVYKDYDGNVLANWITKLNWSELKSSTFNSTCGDDYYVISGGKKLIDFLFELLKDDIIQFKKNSN